MSFHRHSWFPFVVVSLSGALVLLVLVTILPRTSRELPTSIAEDAERSQEALADAYRSAATTVITDAASKLQDAASRKDFTAAVDIASAAQSVLLDLTVPREAQEAHLAFVLLFHRMQTVSAEADGAGLEATLQELSRLQTQYAAVL